MPDEAQVKDTVDQPRSRRERRKRRNKIGFWANPALGRRTGLLVCGLALLAAAYSAYSLRHASLLVGQLQVGTPQAEVAYLFGQPPRTEDNGNRWVYQAGADAELGINFAPDRSIASVTCLAHNEAAFGCPDAMGVGLGTPEDHLLNRLGPASRQTYIPNGKVLTFDDLGLVYTLHQFKVTGFKKVQRTSRFSYVSRLLWNLLP